MTSIASWSPSQSEPLMVSYMCQSQLSSPMLPSAAPIPPCAATVCERVGNTLESTPTLRPAWASSREARMPEPPAPTITASNLRTGMAAMSAPSPEDGGGPGEVAEERQHHGHLEAEADPHRLHVIHEDVPQPDPRVVEQRGEEKQRR